MSVLLVLAGASVDLGCTPPPVGPAPRGAAPLDEQGLAMVRRRRWAEAVRLLRAFLRTRRVREPGRELQARLQLGVALLELGRFAEARRELFRVHRAAPGNARVRLRLGEVYLGMRQGRAALEMLRPLVTLADGHPEVHLLLARAHLRLGREGKALLHARRYTALRPRSWQGWRWLAAAWARRGRPRKSIASLRRAVAVAKRCAREPALLLGEALLGAKQPRQARQVLRAALRCHPREPRFVLALSRACRASKRFAEAERLLVELLGKRPRAVAAWSLLGQVRLDRGRLKDALKALCRARALDRRRYVIRETLIRVHLHLARRALLRGSPAQAVSQLGEALKVDVSHHATHLDLGIAFFAAGKQAAAEAHLQRYHRWRPREPAVLRLLGRLHLRAGRLDRALSFYQAAARVSRRLTTGQHAASELGLAAVYARLGDFTKATSILQSAAANAAGAPALSALVKRGLALSRALQRRTKPGARPRLRSGERFPLVPLLAAYRLR